MKIVSFDGHNLNDTTNYQAFFLDEPLPYGLPAVEIMALMRTGRWPWVSGVQRGTVVRYVLIVIRAGSSGTLAQWFNYEDETPKVFVVENTNGSNDRYWEMICRGLREVPGMAGKLYVAALQVHGDPRLRRVTETSDTWVIGASGATRVIANGGQDEAYPKYRLVPNSSKSSGSTKKRWIKIKWPMADGALRHPTDITNDSFDTAAEVAAGDMQADGDDLRVWVDGVEVNRWLDGMNTTTTKVWVNLDWYPKQTTPLLTAIAGAGAVSEIVVSSDISAFPNQGLLEIGSEIFIYAGKSNYLKKFTGCTRAQRGSSAAAHSVGDTVEWIQHDIYILYDDASKIVPAVDDTQKPIFNLATSTNGSWDYDDFGHSTDPRTGQWAFVPFGGSQKYTALGGGSANPYTAMGITTVFYTGRWVIGHPCLISNANFVNGEKKLSDLDEGWLAGIDSSDDGVNWNNEDLIAEPTVAATFQAWSDSEAIANKKYVSLWMNGLGGTPFAGTRFLGVADVTLTLVNTPTITIGAEEDNYDLDGILTNETTGESIRIYHPMITTATIIEIETYDRIVRRVYTGTEANIYAALTLQEGPRKDWLRLLPGNNTLRFDETGLNGLTITTTFEQRDYE